MPDITTLFWDIGGVVLTNGWDRHARRHAATEFNLDWEEFQDRHDLAFPAFDAGHTTLDEYLDRTLFYRHRPFTREQFTAFMYAQSKEFPESRAMLRAVARSRKYLREDFQVFFSSCYVHSRKPEELIFRFALAVTQRSAQHCLFIDDRPLNLESPRRLGMHAIQYQNAEQLREELKSYGVEV